MKDEQKVTPATQNQNSSDILLDALNVLYKSVRDRKLTEYYQEINKERGKIKSKLYPTYPSNI